MSSGSSGRTGRARRRRSAACSGWPARRRARADCSASRHRPRWRRSSARVGAIVETPALFPTMSGRRNLRLLASHRGDRRRRRWTGCSSASVWPSAVTTWCGRTRSGCGSASAWPRRCSRTPPCSSSTSPPTGSTPAGIKEIRELLRSLGDEGRTVFVSSHLLVEIEHTCDRVAILSHGHCVAAGPVERRPPSRPSHDVAGGDGRPRRLAWRAPRRRHPRRPQPHVPQHRPSRPRRPPACRRPWLDGRSG